MIASSRLPVGHLLLYGWMPSALRRIVYRLFKGYRVGRGVKFGFGSALIGRDVEIGDHVQIGILAVVSGRVIRMADFSSVGTMSYVNTERIEIGEDARIREQVYVGGPQFPDSGLFLGARTIILQQANINTSRPVRIGDDSGIGGHCLIFTHGAWLNELDGYPVTYEPVTIGKSVWLPWRVFVMPGATIGDGSVIGANSLVSGAIPAMSLAVGSPAKVIRGAPDFPRKLTDAERATVVDRIVRGFDELTQYHGYTVRDEAEGLRIYSGAEGSFRLRRRRTPGALEAQPGDTILSETPLTDAERADCVRRGVHWLDLAGRTRSRGGSSLTEELAGFIGRYGMRLARHR